MPGVIRPYTLTDVLQTMNQNQMNQGATTGANLAQLGVIAEADETVVPTADSAAATHSPNAGWDTTYWGAVSWQ